MGFNADAFLAAREPWVLTLEGRTFTAAPLSVLQALTFQQQLEAAKNDEAAQRRALGRLLRLIFPAQWRYLWIGDPVRRILALEPDVQAAILTDFFGHRARILTGTTRTTPPSPLSSAPTPPTPFPAGPVPEVEAVPG